VFPPGQKARDDFPRFGLPQYASRFPTVLNCVSIKLKIDDSDIIDVDISSNELPHTLGYLFQVCG